MNRYHDLPNRSPNQQRRKCGLSILRSHKNKRKNNFLLLLGWWANFREVFLSEEKLSYFLSGGSCLEKLYALFFSETLEGFFNQRERREKWAKIFPTLPYNWRLRGRLFPLRKSLLQIINSIR